MTPTKLLTTATTIALSLSIAAPAFAFPDTANHKYERAIESIKNEGIVSGNPDGTFAPDASITRAAFTKIVVEALFGDEHINSCLTETSISFSDVPVTEWYAKYVCTAKLEQLIDGNPDGTFKPGDPINYAEASKILVNAFGVLHGGPTSVWFEQFVLAMAEAHANPLPTPQPGDNVTRAQMAYMMYRVKGGADFLEREDRSGSHQPDNDCVVAGCSGQLCVPPEHSDIATTCEYKEEYACYEEAVCERQETGECGWTETDLFVACMSHIEPEGEDVGYFEYYDGVVGNGNTSILFFHAAWCPDCRTNDQRLTSLEAEGNFAVPVYKVDYDNSLSLRSLFGVLRQDTFVMIDGNGNVLSTIASPTEADLRTFVELGV